ncbi:MAG: hypothetical protein INR68_03590 [Methylobacterium mesophilicum]|nr:hypothetical protein [Methylobacterium mesophilicum]
MAGLVEGLSLVHSPPTSRIKKSLDGGFKEWLRQANYVPEVQQGKLILTQLDWSECLASLTFDVTRLALAGRETVQNIKSLQGLPYSTSWQLIKAYYASFYYSQACLRMCRTVPSYFKTSDLQRIKAVCDLYSIEKPFPFRTGQYEVETDDFNKQITISRNSSADGTHETLWAEFSKLIDKARDTLPASIYADDEQNQINAELVRLRSVLSSASSGGAWLSSIRNDLQYTQSFGVWYPYVKELRADVVARRAEIIFRDDTSPGSFDIAANNPARRFLECCLFVCFSVRKFLLNINKRVPESFLGREVARLDRTWQDN